MHYEFETNEMGISTEGIHLLRNRFNYKTYPFRDIESMEIGHGRLVNNWLLILVLGCSLVIGAFYYSFQLFLDVIEVRVPRLYIEAFIVPVIPFMLGSYCLWVSLRSGTILKVIQNGRRSSFPLEKLVKANQLESLQTFLHARANFKLLSPLNNWTKDSTS
jgi:hypothetical protein